MKKNECIFCNIRDRKIEANIVYEDEDVMAFHDINPIAPVHILIIPKMHIGSLFVVWDEDAPIMGKMIVVATKLAKQFELFNGYRLVINCGKDGLQEVKHLHLHLMGGRRLAYPIG